MRGNIRETGGGAARIYELADVRPVAWLRFRRQSQLEKLGVSKEIIDAMIRRVMNDEARGCKLVHRKPGRNRD